MTAMADIKQICTELASLARREHYFCEDSWYSCPKAEGGCANDAEGDECTCGADAHNAKVNELLAAALTEPEPEVPTTQKLKTFACEWWKKFGFVKDKATCCWVLDEVDPDHFADFARAVLARWGARGR